MAITYQSVEQAISNGASPEQIAAMLEDSKAQLTDEQIRMLRDSVYLDEEDEDDEG